MQHQLMSAHTKKRCVSNSLVAVSCNRCTNKYSQKVIELCKSTYKNGTRDTAATINTIPYHTTTHYQLSTASGFKFVNCDFYNVSEYNM